MKWYAKIWTVFLKGILFFLLPVILLVIVVEKALFIIQKIIYPIKSHLPEDGFFGIGLLSILSIFMLLSISFIAGIWADKRKIESMIPRLEEKLLVFIPGFALIKTQAKEAIGDTNDNWKSVIVGDNEDFKLGIEIERHVNGYSMVFFPDPLDGKSGELKLIDSNKIKNIDLTVNKLLAVIKQYGRGSTSFIK